MTYMNCVGIFNSSNPLARDRHRYYPSTLDICLLAPTLSMKVWSLGLPVLLHLQQTINNDMIRMFEMQVTEIDKCTSKYTKT
jgi:hypothetical protein